MNALGRHLIIELKGCPAELLDDLPFIEDTMVHAAESTGVTIVGKTFHKFAPQGVTGVVAIAESHLCIHTWPEYGYAAADVFTCGEGFDPNDAADFIADKLGAQHCERTELTRGVLTPMAEARA